MKSGILPLVALGVGAWFLSKPKQTTTESKSKGVITGSKERGYVITNCNLVIYDAQKAFDYAFSIGSIESKKSEWNTNPLKFNLFGDCLSSEEKVKKLITNETKALFIFDLVKFMWSGIASNSESYAQDGLNALTQLKNNISKLITVDVSKFKVELVKKT